MMRLHIELALDNMAPPSILVAQAEELLPKKMLNSSAEDIAKILKNATNNSYKTCLDIAKAIKSKQQ